MISYVVSAPFFVSLAYFSPATSLSAFLLTGEALHNLGVTTVGVLSAWVRWVWPNPSIFSVETSNPSIFGKFDKKTVFGTDN